MPRPFGPPAAPGMIATSAASRPWLRMRSSALRPARMVRATHGTPRSESSCDDLLSSPKFHSDPAFPMSRLFSPLRLRSRRASPTASSSRRCASTPREDGMPNDWHFVHLGSRAVGGAALVLRRGERASRPRAASRPGTRASGRRRTRRRGSRSADFIRTHGAVPGDPDRARGPQGLVQQAVAGRQAALARARAAWMTLGPERRSPSATIRAPRAMTRGRDRADGRGHSARAARARARRRASTWSRCTRRTATCSTSSCSPLSNRRTDDYGGSLENRMRFPLEVARAVRERVARRTSRSSIASPPPTGRKAAGTSRSRSSSARR